MVEEAVRFYYGRQQSFRRRFHYLVVLGVVDCPAAPYEATYSLNGGQPRPLYVENVPVAGYDTSYEYKPSPARLRLNDRGDFAIEIDADDPELMASWNRIEVRIKDAAGHDHSGECQFEWDPRPIVLPVRPVADAAVHRVQDVGFAVNGLFEWDPEWRVVRTKAPVWPDSLLLVGAPGGSQEATYEFRTLDARASKYVGLSDFFLGHEQEDPSLPVRQLWSTAGLATIRPRGEFAWEARIWIARRDAPGWRPGWKVAAAPRLVRTDPPSHFPLTPGSWYGVRHRVEIGGGRVTSKVRIWPAGGSEPSDWLCAVSVDAVEFGWVKPPRPCFGLFQHSGFPSEWRRIEIRELDSSEPGLEVAL